ncbi:hypothetical protein EYZ11_010264 [Aspergillus tanneri]|uniref:Uncharacterized protein n=1 Tax=Aspergillus tanneri TaxID=1220188 RepID=A0A4S3J5T0_9EURO|nr:uncharacterized protein ATNIH1004_004576 [Aspergillus tanneri]KAA8648691.1 hypothetical protein ATNIH1004_004576 [Aspergillus tanneri]THC90270.1 hypothetical protein EYZ11_010264 [Aspergillus tanneri]
MSKKVIFLTGAPTLQSLSWEENELLNAPVYPFHDAGIENERFRSFSDACNPVKWRLLQDLAIPEVSTPKDISGSQVARFFTINDLATPSRISIPATEDSALSQFYDHSFEIHETSEISAPGDHSEDSLKESRLWADSTGSSIATSSDEEALRPALSMHGHITDLQEIPSAAYLEGIVPQTMTVNLIVSIITIRPPRRIVTRHWQRELDLVEMVVGDDTRSGFGVTFWLQPAERDCGDEHELGRSLSTVRPRDIVLLRMVALSSFRKRVYGQSLRKGVTKIDLLHRHRVDATDTGGMYSARRLREINQDGAPKNVDDAMRAKVSKVHEWIKLFVPDAEGGDSNRQRQGGPRHFPKKNPLLPPDTPEDSGYN